MNDHMDKSEAIEGHKAYEAGCFAGGIAASWVEISDEQTARRILAGIDDCDPEVMDMQPDPLSGEYAGESVPELSREYGMDLWDDDIATAFEHGYSEAFWDAVTIAAQNALPETVLGS